MRSRNTLIDDIWSVGAQKTPLFFPDIGTFFNQDLEIAKNLISQIALAGAPIIKGEILHDAEIALASSEIETYLATDGSVINEKIRDVIERKIISLANYEDLFSFCKALGLEFVVSVYDNVGAAFARDIGASALKIASSNIVHRPLIEKVAQLDLPMVIDTGKSTFVEIARAIQWAKDAGAKMILIQHSPLAPPAPTTSQNLRFLEVLRTSFDCPVGLSDHHNGEEMLYAAIALGASCVEKGIMADDLIDEQDGYHALKISEFASVYEKCMNIAKAVGNVDLRLTDSLDRHNYRMGMVAAQEIRKGQHFDEQSVRFAFPAKGIPVENWGAVCGRIAQRDISCNSILCWDDIDLTTK